MNRITSELPGRRSNTADAEKLMALWTLLIQMRAERRESLSLEQADCLEVAAQCVARFLNLTESRAFQQHLKNLPEDFPLVM